MSGYKALYQSPGVLVIIYRNEVCMGFVYEPTLLQHRPLWFWVCEDEVTKSCSVSMPPARELFSWGNVSLPDNLPRGGVWPWIEGSMVHGLCSTKAIFQMRCLCCERVGQVVNWGCWWMLLILLRARAICLLLETSFTSSALWIFNSWCLWKSLSESGAI